MYQWPAVYPWPPPQPEQMQQHMAYADPSMARQGGPMMKRPFGYEMAQQPASYGMFPPGKRLELPSPAMLVSHVPSASAAGAPMQKTPQFNSAPVATTAQAAPAAKPPHQLQFVVGPVSQIYKDANVGIKVKIVSEPDADNSGFQSIVHVHVALVDVHNNVIETIVKGRSAGARILAQELFTVPLTSDRHFMIPNIRVREVSANHGGAAFALQISLPRQPQVAPARSQLFYVRSERMRSPSYVNTAGKLEPEIITGPAPQDNLRTIAHLVRAEFLARGSDISAEEADLLTLRLFETPIVSKPRKPQQQLSQPLPQATTTAAASVPVPKEEKEGVKKKEEGKNLHADLTACNSFVNEAISRVSA
eukprot:TRINITY_DN13668_c0_g1_i1.p1 TRINITY_DN13668_c0_g1~~TRINITY_DN13668_c0_g1_i1.p1  ORF type:complete len:363 (-),score=51.16 TRINITY_DN13668_c0_g1_i1:75-1163(-)